MSKVYVVQYRPGEPDGVYTLCICATRDRAEVEEVRYVVEEGFDPDHVFVEEVDLLE